MVQVQGLLMAHSQSVARDGVVAPGALAERLAGGFHFTGEPTCDAEGNVFFTDQPNDRILRVERGSP
jgi:gluconolactonase